MYQTPPIHWQDSWYLAKSAGFKDLCKAECAAFLQTGSLLCSTLGKVELMYTLVVSGFRLHRTPWLFQQSESVPALRSDPSRYQRNDSANLSVSAQVMPCFFCLLDVMLGGTPLYLAFIKNKRVARTRPGA